MTKQENDNLFAKQTKSWTDRHIKYCFEQLLNASEEELFKVGILFVPKKGDLVEWTSRGNIRRDGQISPRISRR